MFKSRRLSETDVEEAKRVLEDSAHDNLPRRTLSKL